MEYKVYTYLGYSFYKTGDELANSNDELYEIGDMKPAGMRPFLTSIRECREFIRDSVDMGYFLDGGGRTHYVKRRR